MIYIDAKLQRTVPQREFERLYGTERPALTLDGVQFTISCADGEYEVPLVQHILQQGRAHKEAYCLMWYRCEKCQHRERIWNSRDGVTPFTILCPRLGIMPRGIGYAVAPCGGTMQHVDWTLDECKPDHVPNRGERIFTDYPLALAHVHACMRVRDVANSGVQMPKTFDELVESVAEDFLRPGQPWVVAV